MVVVLIYSWPHILAGFVLPLRMFLKGKEGDIKVFVSAFYVFMVYVVAGL